MKKLMIVLALILLVSSSAFALTTVGNGDLTVYGKILPGETQFQVVQDQLVTERVDLLSSAVSPTSDGYIIGSWVFTAVNQLSKDYTVTYEYDGLLGASNTIEYELLEYAEGASTGGTVLATTSDTTEFTSTAGNYDDGRNLGFRLTAAGVTSATGAPSGNYEDTITITLTTI